jgi:hypothetical protein
MNERIRLLAEQAFFDDATTQPSDRMYTFSDHKMQKFAELIVRECVSVMYDNAIEREVPPDIDKTPTHYAVALLKHFGVES